MGGGGGGGGWWGGWVGGGGMKWEASKPQRVQYLGNGVWRLLQLDELLVLEGAAVVD
jgi:hypothetical protein